MEQQMDKENRKDRAAYSIPDWCDELGFSVSFYHKLQKQGLGPRVMHVGARTLVTETPREYCKRREAVSAPAELSA
jgi:hypothetical protein